MGLDTARAGVGGRFPIAAPTTDVQPRDTLLLGGKRSISPARSFLGER